MWGGSESEVSPKRVREETCVPATGLDEAQQEPGRPQHGGDGRYVLLMKENPSTHSKGW